MRWKITSPTVVGAPASCPTSGPWSAWHEAWVTCRRPATCGPRSPRVCRRRPGEQVAEVIPLRTGGRPKAEPRGVYLSRPQLAAAAVVIAMVSAAATWALGPGTAVRQVGSPLPMPTAVSPAAKGEGPPPALAERARPPRGSSQDGRGIVWTPRPCASWRRTWTSSIAPSRIRGGPWRPTLPTLFLREHLDRAYQQKVDYLREAAGIAGWAG